MRVVQCHGCFDLLHIGHIRHFEAAKQHGDRLVVTVTSDAYVNKGPGRPVFPVAVRAEAVRALKCVDDVLVSDAPTAANAIRTVRPQVFAKGPDYASGIHPDERAALDEVGAELVITETEKWSSSALLRDAALSPEAQAYLSHLRERYRPADVLAYLERARALRVLVIGDAIRDEYHYVDTLGKSGKDPMLAVQFKRAESFVGGAEAVGRHARACADHVDVVTGPVTVKRRFIEQYPFQKLFEVYEMDPFAANDETPRLLAELPDAVASADVVIVADYGHGLMTPPLVDLVSQSRFLAVNTQANAGNHGFNTISKYTQADFISLSERELRLDARDQQQDVRGLASAASRRHSGRMLVTRGERGCFCASGVAGADAPALTNHAVDRTGAGDAVFAIAACCAAVRMPLDLLTFMASVVGTQAVGIVGNARYIERDALWRAVEGYLS